MRYVLAFAALTYAGQCFLPAAAEPRPMQVVDIIETGRLYTGEIERREVEGRRYFYDDGVSVSPNGLRFASIVVRGDVANDSVTAEIITSSLETFETAVDVRVAARLSARLRGNTDLVLAFSGAMRWLDEDHVALRWEAEDGSVQVFRIDLVSGGAEQLTRQAGDVTAFFIGPDGTILYQSPQPPSEGPITMQTGGVVQSIDAHGLLNGDFHRAGLLSRAWSRIWYLQRPGEAVRSLDLNGLGYDTATATGASFSPDGRFAVVAATPAHVPEHWAAYRGRGISLAVAEELRTPRSGQRGLSIRHYALIDLATGVTRTLFDAPAHITSRQVAFWSSNSRSFVLGPTYLPTPTDDVGLDGAALVEIDARTLRRSRVPIQLPGYERGAYERIVWIDDATIQVENAGERRTARRANGRWRAIAAGEGPSRLAANIEIELREGANTPPALYVIDRQNGAARLAFDPNPDLLARFALGHVEQILWTADDGREWSGMLYRPVGYEPSRRYPLVIQTHGHGPPTQFSLNGLGYPAMGPAVSIYAAQVLSGRGMFVLQVDEPPNFADGREELDATTKAFTSAIATLAGRGLIDEGRVGISGWSRTGWHVLHALTHSDFEFAAAIVSDNIDGGYFTSTLMPGALYFEGGAGSAPYGEGLENWLEIAPAFHVQRLRTPLRVQRDGADAPGQLLGSWEFFSRARNLNMPVEMYLVPDVGRGAHTLQNPTQSRASQEGAVEWFDFWLNDVTPDGARRTELEHLRESRDRVHAQPRPPILNWSAHPRE